MMPFIQIKNLRHEVVDRRKGVVFTLVIDDPPLTIGRGDFTSILGKSACGKTTLLTLVGLLHKPSDVDNVDFEIDFGDDIGKRTIAELWKKENEAELEEIRRTRFGFALQSGELLPSLTVAENIAVPMRLNQFSDGVCVSRVKELLEGFRLEGEPANKPVNRLSGGEYQRVVLARSIAHKPKIVFVDEPTSSLDYDTAVESLDILKRLQHDQLMTIVMITHDEKLANKYSASSDRGQIVHMTSNNKKDRDGKEQRGGRILLRSDEPAPA